MTLHTKYRPTTFDEVVGQEDAVSAIKGALESGNSRAFLLHGPAGTGKTTLARIIASEFGADDMGLIEIDGATHTGIDNMRKVAETSYFKSLGGSGKRCYIVDECHMLSKQTWNSLLKIVEEPPEHVVWVFCTTEVHKVPKTIRSRCIDPELNEVSVSVLRQMVTEVAEKEGLDISEDVARQIARMSMGSPRVALVGLAKIGSCDDAEKATMLMKQSDGEKEAFDLAKLIFGKSFTFPNAVDILKNLKDNNPESVRIVVFAYATSVWLGKRSATDAEWASRVLGVFELPCTDQNKIGDIALRVMRLLQFKK